MRTRTVVAITAAILISGCAAQSGVDYYWGDYSATLFALKKEPSEETQQTHIAELEKIITKSGEKGYRVPPGVQAELGYLYAKMGQMEMANASFQAEMTVYPESRLFIEKLQGMFAE